MELDVCPYKDLHVSVHSGTNIKNGTIECRFKQFVEYSYNEVLITQ